jgi:transcriptional regulator with XRE-family HTH domain/quercetin dioxygenase-like cupin family protein
MDHLGRRLKDARLRAGITLRELGRQADVSPSLISQIENGKSLPSVATLYVFARLLNVSVDGLFGGRGVAAATIDRAVGAATGIGSARTSGPGLDPIRAWRPSEHSNRVSIVHPAHRPQLAMADGVLWERLAATPEPDVNFMKIDYAPGAASGTGGDPCTHQGYEYGYVLSGKVEVTVGDEVFVLRRGESLGFDSTIPHVLRNPGPEVFEGIWLVHGGRY